MRKLKVLLLNLVILMLFAMPAYAEMTLTVDGKEFALETINRQGSSLIPLRDASEVLGAKVNYISDLGVAYIERYGTVLQINMGDGLAHLNGKMVSSGVPPVVINGKAYVPLRFLAESLNYEVVYDNGRTNLTSKPIAKVHFIDVGFGDAIFIQLLNDKNILIDAGDKKGGGLVATYLRNHGVKEIDVLVASTTAEEHMGGIPAVLRAFKVNKLIDSYNASNDDFYKEYKAELEKRSILHEQASKQKYDYSGVVFEILSNTNKMMNQSSPTKTIISSLTVGKYSFLFMSDRTGQNELTDIPNNNYTVLKVADHAGIVSSSQKLIDRVKPEVAVVTGDDSKAGYPKGTTLQRIKESGADLYSTGTNGNIIVETNELEYKVKVDNDQPIEILPEKEHELHLTTGAQNGKYVGDRTTGFYHHPNCEEVNYISEENKVWFIDKLQAELSGYKPDEICRPK